MRRIIRRPERIPEHRRSDEPGSKQLTSNDYLFLELLQNHHRQQKYQYMKQWWEEPENKR